MDASAFGISRRSNDFLLSPESFCRSVRVLMYGYAIVSMADQKGSEWRSLEADLHHVSAVENLSRAKSRPDGPMRGRIDEAEEAARSEWAKLGQAQPCISLTAIIDVISHRHAIWPLLSEFARNVATRNNRGGWGEKGWNDKGNGWQDKGKGAL